MAFTTKIGFLAGLGLFIGWVLIAILNIAVFLCLSSSLVVAGGAIVATFFGKEARYVVRVYSVNSNPSAPSATFSTRK